jgi:hypothetical protein
VKFTPDPLVVFGSELGPDPKRVFMRGAFAGAFAGAMGGLARETEAASTAPVFVVERRFPRVRVRGWHPVIDGKLWRSPGHLSMSVIAFARLWLRALWKAGQDPIPRAQVRR